MESQGILLCVPHCFARAAAAGTGRAALAAHPAVVLEQRHERVRADRRGARECA